MSEEEVQPRDAKIVKTILQSMGVEHYEPRVVHQFLDFSYRYVLEVLEDANVYAEHAGKAALDTDDVRLAIQAKVNVSFSQPPAREKLMELAKLRNSLPLPTSVGSSTLALPPEADSLIAPNYQLAVPSRPVLDRLDNEQEQGSKNGNEDRDGDGPVSQPTQLQRTDQDRKVSFAISNKRMKSG